MNVQEQTLPTFKPATEDAQRPLAPTVDVGELLGKMDVAEQTAIKVKVIYGANDEEVEVPAGTTFGAIKAELKDAWSIPEDAMMLIEGEPVQEDYVLQAGTTAEFYKQAGVKG